MKKNIFISVFVGTFLLAGLFLCGYFLCGKAHFLKSFFKRQDAKVVSHFLLTDMRGNVVTERDFLGHPTLYFFGFTHCPDICPTQLGAASIWLDALGDDAKDLKTLFTSVDYERDSPQKMAEYMKSFDSRIVAAVGTREKTEKMAKDFMVYYAKVPLKEGGYTMNHTASVLMVDKEGYLKGIIPMGMPDDEAVERIRSVLLR